MLIVKRRLKEEENDEMHVALLADGRDVTITAKLFDVTIDVTTTALTINIIVLDETSSIAKYVHSTLLTIVDLSLPNRRVTIGRNPDSGVGIRVDAVLEELSEAVLVDVDAAREAVMDVAAHHRRVGAGLHLEPRDTVGVDVVSLEVALRMGRGEEGRGQ